MSISYVITDGQLVRLYHSRPETAWPGETARRLCKANDRNGEYDYFDRPCHVCEGSKIVDAATLSGVAYCAHCRGDGREPVPLELCAAVLNTWVVEDPPYGERWIARWLAQNACALGTPPSAGPWAVLYDRKHVGECEIASAGCIVATVNEYAFGAQGANAALLAAAPTMAAALRDIYADLILALASPLPRNSATLSAIARKAADALTEAEYK